MYADNSNTTLREDLTDFLQFYLHFQMYIKENSCLGSAIAIYLQLTPPPLKSEIWPYLVNTRATPLIRPIFGGP